MILDTSNPRQFKGKYTLQLSDYCSYFLLYFTYSILILQQNISLLNMTDCQSL